MIDRQSFMFVPGNIKGLFQRLNGAPMYDILDTLDALLKEKNFYPNVGVYRNDLDTAGIYVARMEVAMQAVMAKNSSTTSYTQFTAQNSVILAQLPQDQRDNIAKYFTGSTSTPGMANNALIAQYLKWGNDALFKVRNFLLDRGAPNRFSDWPKGAPILGLPGYDRADSLDPEVVAKTAIANRGGNCDEFSATAFVQLKSLGARPIHWVKLTNGDHAFVLIGEGPSFSMNNDQFLRWKDSVVVCDAWDKACYVASEIPNRLPGFNKTFEASRYAVHPDPQAPRP